MRLIKVGTLVRRVKDDALPDVKHYDLTHLYPPEGAVCVVVSNPKEIDVSPGRKSWGSDGWVALAKAIDVMCDNKIYEGCELRAFEKV